MLSPSYNIDEFIKAIKDKEFSDLFRCVADEIQIVESISFGNSGAVKARESGSIEYLKNLKGLMYILQTLEKPLAINSFIFSKFAPIFKSLQVQGKIKQESFDKLFGNTN